MKPSLLLAATLWLLASAQGFAQTRQCIGLNDGWKTVSHETDPHKHDKFELPLYDDADWLSVDVPHNWDRYHGFRRLKHGNFHGTAWYRKWFSAKVEKGKRYFLFFEGVGSYATVFVNGKMVGTHAGGRTTFTLDVTHALNTNGKPNLLAVKAEHPAEIRDLPWVCGGCSSEWGFSEGSQPLGIFRPVQLIVTHHARIEPFGVHVWNDTTVNRSSALLHLNTEVSNHGSKAVKLKLVNLVVDDKGMVKGSATSLFSLPAQKVLDSLPQTIRLANVRLWSPDDPYLYTVVTQLFVGKRLIDQTETRYGVRWIQWPIGKTNHSGQFFINGKPFFINGTADYEHQMGMSHAFTDEQVSARARQIKAAGYNAFRDAHQPHNLRYHGYWDEWGLLWWPQMAAHIWFDTPEFRHNFKTLLKQMVKERRNSPSAILWGLENESTLPSDFAQECVQLIRQMDPTAADQRLVTTCNGGTGTDWNVVQNWSGTYGGNPYNYANEIAQQLLNGEYGAWRSIDFHTEGPYVQNGPLSEDRMTLLMELKIREAEKARHQSCGQFHWLFNSHENPGRIQNGEGLRDIDRIGPVNYKGLFTPWGEPTDAFYMYRANYAPKETDPMVYIVSHTWPNRYTTGGKKDGLIVYSNCDEVELFNDVEGLSLGKRQNGGVGTHFLWDGVELRHNVLRAVGYVNGQAVANDLIVLQNLPLAPNFDKLYARAEPQAPTSHKTLYRVNCGGPDYTDLHGNRWMADVHWTDSSSWGSLSWTDDFAGLPHFYASQRRMFDPVMGTRDWPLYQTFRYGTDRLRYRFPVQKGKYTVQLHFTEPWYGTGGGMDCKGWRLFDVAVNNRTYLHDLDIWLEAGHDHALVKSFEVEVDDQTLEISFPKTKAGQAIVSAIAVHAHSPSVKAAPPAPKTIGIFTSNTSAQPTIETWLDWGDKLHPGATTTVVTLPPALFAAQWVKMSLNNGQTPAFELELATEANVFVALNPDINTVPLWMDGFTDTQTAITTSDELTYKVYVKKMPRGERLKVQSAGCTNGQAPWIVAAQAAFNLPQAADQRPVHVYEPNLAQVSGQGETGIYRERNYVKIGHHAHTSITWKISTGVADVYSLNLRYFQQGAQPVKGRIVLTTADGISMMEQEVVFQPMRPDGTWRSIRTATSSTINAGNYYLTLTLIGAENAVCAGALEVQ